MDYEIDNKSKEDDVLIEELNSFFFLCDENFLKDRYLEKIIITNDFDNNVRKYRNNKDYISERRVDNAIGITIDIVNEYERKNIIILKKELFSALPRDLKYQFLAHELDHCFNNMNLPNLIPSSYSKFLYLWLLKRIFDEYSAVRFSLNIFGNIFDNSRLELINICFDSHINQLNDPEIYLKPFLNEYQNFKEHKDNKILFKSIYPIIESLSINIFYMLAFLDSCGSHLNNSGSINVSLPFFNIEVIEIWKIIQRWMCSKNNNINYEEGIFEIINYISKIGFYFSNEGIDILCHPLEYNLEKLNK